ncbi:hypothetical protein Avbf_09504 [Armadillidium vulgare]|nr:hypothetical protein Avbf_09504 [Armadillidium vulgare]
MVSFLMQSQNRTIPTKGASWQLQSKNSTIRHASDSFPEAMKRIIFTF